MFWHWLLISERLSLSHWLAVSLSLYRLWRIAVCYWNSLPPWRSIGQLQPDLNVFLRLFIASAASPFCLDFLLVSHDALGFLFTSSHSWKESSLSQRRLVQVALLDEHRVPFVHTTPPSVAQGGGTLGGEICVFSASSPLLLQRAEVVLLCPVGKETLRLEHINLHLLY